MKRPEDLDWDRLVERIELDASDADLAAADEALRGAESDEVRPELVDAVMARVRAEVQEAQEVEQSEIPILRQPQPIRALPRFRRLAAAAAAFLFGTKLSAATTVTTLAVVTTLTVIVVRNSTWELSYSGALEILGNSDASVDAAQSALFVVSKRMQLSIQDLQEVRDDPTSPPMLVDPIRQGLRDVLAGAPLDWTISLEDIRASAQRARNRTSDEGERLFYVRNTLALLARGMATLNSLHRPELQDDCKQYRGRLRFLLKS